MPLLPSRRRREIQVLLSSSLAAGGSAGTVPGAWPFPARWLRSAVAPSTGTSVRPAGCKHYCSSGSVDVRDETCGYIFSADTAAIAELEWIASASAVEMNLDLFRYLKDLQTDPREG